MPLQLSMVGLVVEDMARALAFYRRLGLDIPADVDDRPHVEMRMEGGVTLFWDTAFARTYDPDRAVPAGGYRILPEFFLADRGAVDATYADLTGHGHRGHRAPFETAFGAYMAMVDDPDGKTVLITAALREASRVSRQGHDDQPQRGVNVPRPQATSGVCSDQRVWRMRARRSDRTSMSSPSAVRRIWGRRGRSVACFAD